MTKAVVERTGLGRRVLLGGLSFGLAACVTPLPEDFPETLVARRNSLNGAPGVRLGQPVRR